MPAADHGTPVGSLSVTPGRDQEGGHAGLARLLFLLVLAGGVVS